MGSKRGARGTTSVRRTSSSGISASVALSCLILMFAGALTSGCAKPDSESYGSNRSDSAGMSDSDGEDADSAQIPGGPAGRPAGGGQPPAAKGSPIKIPSFQEVGTAFSNDLKTRIESAYAQACRDAGNDPSCVTLTYAITLPGEQECAFGGLAPPGGTTVDAGTTVTVKLSGREPCPVSDTDDDGTTDNGTTDDTTDDGTTGHTTTDLDVGPTAPDAPSGR